MTPRDHKLAILRHADLQTLRDLASEAADLARPIPVPPLSTDYRTLAGQLAILLVLERERSRRLLALMAR